MCTSGTILIGIQTNEEEVSSDRDGDGDGDGDWSFIGNLTSYITNYKEN